MRSAISRKTVAVAAAGIVAVLLGLGALGMGLGWFGQQTVQVKTGERIVCVYGETVSQNIILANVPRADASEYSVRTKTVLCAKHQRLEKLYREAQDALSRNDTATALPKLQSVVAGDAKFGSAAKQVAAIQAGKTPAPDTSSTRPTGGATGTDTGNGDSGTGEPTGPTASLRTWVPDALAGFKAGAINSDPVSLSREYTPVSGSAPVSVLVIDVEQRQSVADAVAATKQLADASYSDARSSVKVNGRSAAFGTDGRGFAIVAVADGTVLVVFEGRVRSGNAAGLRSELVRIAGLVVK